MDGVFHALGDLITLLDDNGRAVGDAVGLTYVQVTWTLLGTAVALVLLNAYLIRRAWRAARS